MKQQNCIDTMYPGFELPTAPKLDAAQGIWGSVRALFETLCVWQQRTEMRARMARLDAKMLDDIGLTREQVMAEAKKPFWKA